MPIQGNIDALLEDSIPANVKGNKTVEMTFPCLNIEELTDPEFSAAFYAADAPMRAAVLYAADGRLSGAVLMEQETESWTAVRRLYSNEKFEKMLNTYGEDLIFIWEGNTHCIVTPRSGVYTVKR